jgi:chemotaxis protein MotA
MPNHKIQEPPARPDIAALLGAAVAIAGILGGLVMEGGRISDVSQITAALIVFGGTIGAVMLTTPFSILKTAAGRLKQVVVERPQSPFQTIETIVGLSAKARKTGLMSLEQEAMGMQDPFLHKALTLAVDGMELQAIREMMQLQMRMEAADADTDARVYEAAGGYAPTIGIIGAVIGLIQVMKHLDDINRVGAGIAVAFVATIYGVGSANLFFLPLAQKIRLRTQQAIRTKEMMLEGVASISEGTNPRLIRRKLESFIRENRESGRWGEAPAKEREEALA